MTTKPVDRQRRVAIICGIVGAAALGAFSDRYFDVIFPLASDARWYFFASATGLVAAALAYAIYRFIRT